VIPFDSERSRDPMPRGRSPRRSGAHEESDWGGRLGASAAEPEAVSTWVEIADEPRHAPASRAAWFAAPLLLAAVAAGTAFVLRGPDGVFGIAFGALLALGLGWILISALFPARAERTCPQCGRDELARLDPDSSQGLVCRACAWADESASAFLLLEDDGQPFEDIVLRGRGRGGKPRA